MSRDLAQWEGGSGEGMLCQEWVCGCDTDAVGEVCVGFVVNVRGVICLFR